MNELELSQRMVALEQKVAQLERALIEEFNKDRYEGKSGEAVAYWESKYNKEVEQRELRDKGLMSILNIITCITGPHVLLSLLSNDMIRNAAAALDDDTDD